MASPECNLACPARSHSSSCKRSLQNPLLLTRLTRNLTTLLPRAHSDRVNRISSHQPAARAVARQAPLLQVSSRPIRAKALKSKHRQTIYPECNMAIISSKGRIISPQRIRTRNRSNTTTNIWRARSCLAHRKATRQTVAALFRQVKAIKSRPMVPQALLKVKTLSLDR